MLSESQLDQKFSQLSRWTPYRSSGCDNCMSLCCRLPVEVTAEDLVRLGLVPDFEWDRVSLKRVAKDLIKAGKIASFRATTGLFTLKQQASGDCVFLDSKTRRCTVYNVRPHVCRSFPNVGPRPGYCPQLSSSGQI